MQAQRPRHCQVVAARSASEYNMRELHEKRSRRRAVVGNRQRQRCRGQKAQRPCRSCRLLLLLSTTLTASGIYRRCMISCKTSLGIRALVVGVLGTSWIWIFLLEKHAGRRTTISSGFIHAAVWFWARSEQRTWTDGTSRALVRTGARRCPFSNATTQKTYATCWCAV